MGRNRLERTLPLAARFPKGKIFREDRFPVPPDALREILLNAVMHRDYSQPSSNVAVAIFDDRIEIRSVGTLPSGVTVGMLSKPHLSRRRNPMIAETFHRVGAVEIWGRGTNRVIEACRRHGIPAPTFHETTGSLIVTFQVPIGRTPHETPHETTHVTTHETTHVTPQVRTLLKVAEEPRSREELQRLLRLKNRRHFQKAILDPLLASGWLVMTIPDKPKSRLQRYRASAEGLAQLKRKGPTSA